MNEPKKRNSFLFLWILCLICSFLLVSSDRGVERRDSERDDEEQKSLEFESRTGPFAPWTEGSKVDVGSLSLVPSLGSDRSFTIGPGLDVYPIITEVTIEEPEENEHKMKSKIDVNENEEQEHEDHHLEQSDGENQFSEDVNNLVDDSPFSLDYHELETRTERENSKRDRSRSRSRSNHHHDRHHSHSRSRHSRSRSHHHSHHDSRHHHHEDHEHDHQHRSRDDSDSHRSRDDDDDRRDRRERRRKVYAFNDGFFGEKSQVDQAQAKPFRKDREDHLFDDRYFDPSNQSPWKYAHPHIANRPFQLPPDGGDDFSTPKIQGYPSGTGGFGGLNGGRSGNRGPGQIGTQFGGLPSGGYGTGGYGTGGKITSLSVPTKSSYTTKPTTRITTKPTTKKPTTKKPTTKKPTTKKPTTKKPTTKLSLIHI
eukprot:TRINITY_DN3165_c0_g1_i1.p1 TRINITY_DN3165_c0_g1~~TRINITY_DN3165_c0_g1_i1.p1  ORF type:complete len:424 (-),score=98.60 TRINITY_DN3165_c0_g1_i1:41-1312(-)